MYYKLINNCKWLPPKGFYGIVLYPFIFTVPQGLSRVQLNHELIHVKQQRELLVILFYIIYLIEYGIKLVYYRNQNKAYRNISFEREAYSNQLNNTYLQNRPLWNWIRYLKK